MSPVHPLYRGSSQEPRLCRDLSFHEAAPGKKVPNSPNHKRKIHAEIHPTKGKRMSSWNITTSPRASANGLRLRYVRDYLLLLFAAPSPWHRTTSKKLY